MIDNIIKIALLLIDTVIEFYYLVAIIHIILSWLLAFGILDSRHPIAQRIVGFVYGLMNPIYDWIYRFLRPIGGGMIAMLDFRPLLFLLFLYFFKPMIHTVITQLLLWLQ